MAKTRKGPEQQKSMEDFSNTSFKNLDIIDEGKKNLVENLSEDEKKIGIIAYELISGDKELKDIKLDEYERYDLAKYLSKNGFDYIEYLGTNFEYFADNVDFVGYKEGRKIIDRLIKEDFKDVVEKNIGKIWYIPFYKMRDWFGEKDAIRIMSENCEKVTFNCDLRDDNRDDIEFLKKFIDESYVSLLCIDDGLREDVYYSHPDYLEYFEVNGEVMARLVSNGLDVWIDHIENNYEYDISNDDDVRERLLHDFMYTYLRMNFEDIEGLVKNLSKKEINDLLFFLQCYEYRGNQGNDNYRVLVGDLIKYAKQKYRLPKREMIRSRDI